MEIAVLPYADTNRIQIRKFFIAFQGDLHEFDIHIKKNKKNTQKKKTNNNIQVVRCWIRMFQLQSWKDFV